MLLLLILFGKTFFKLSKNCTWQNMGIRMRSLCRAKNSECVHGKQSQLLTCWGNGRGSDAAGQTAVVSLLKMNAWKNHFNVWMPIGDGGQPLWALVNALRIYMIHIHLHIHIRLGNPAQPRAIQRHSCWAWIMGLSREVVVSICCSMGTLCVCWARVKTMCDTIWIFDYFSGVHTSCIIHQLIAPHLGLQKIEANRWGDQTIIL